MVSCILALLIPLQEVPGDGALSGDLWGARPALAGHGVASTLVYTGEVMANVHGGLDTGADYMGLMDWGVDLDLAPLMGWTGGSARFNPFWIAGEGITDARVGDLYRVSNIDARDAIRVFEFWVQQQIGIASIRAGLMAADQEFAVIESALLFVNSAYGPPPTLSLNEASPVYPLGALGARLKIETGSGFTAQVAVYEGSPGDEYLNETGLDVSLNDDEGVLALAELGWTWEEGSLKAGLFHHTGATQEHHTGFYAILQQAVWLEGPVLFLRPGLAEEEISTLWGSVETGVLWRGLIPGRERDECMLGLVWGRLSRDFAAAQAVPSEWRYEAVVELTYRIALTPWLVLQPNAQFVRHPGGTDAVDDAWVLGLRVDLTL